jgi:hypothetical protein
MRSLRVFGTRERLYEQALRRLDRGRSNNSVCGIDCSRRTG